MGETQLAFEHSPRLRLVQEVAPPPVALLSVELPTEEWVRARFNRRFLGAVGISQTVEVGVTPDNTSTLASAIDRAVEGDTEASQLVDINITTAAGEACFKDDYATRVTKEVNDNGEIVQFGLTGHQMHYNSLVLRPNRPDALKAFTVAEALNGYREQAYLQAGLLDEYFMLTASCVPENMPEEQLDYRGEGYFTRTMSYSMQATTAEGDKVVTETAFRKGTAADETALYADRQAQRYDLEAIGMVYESLGFPAPKTALEFLENPLLLKKSEFPNGILDVLRRCDIAADVLQDVMRPRDIADYLDLFERSAARDATLKDVKTKVREDLLGAAGTFEQPEDAIALLWDLVRDHAVRDAGSNEAIDAIAFGPLAAAHIGKAREAHAVGDDEGRDKWISEAMEVSSVSGCGGGSCGLTEVDPTSAIGQEVSSMLDIKPGDAMVRDDERPCGNCGTVGTVYYVFNASKVNKCCVSCKAVEKDGKAQAEDNATQLS